MSKTVTLPAVLNIRKTAEYLGVSYGVAYNLFHREDFPRFRVGYTWLVDTRRLGEWVAQQGAIGEKEG